MSDKQEAVSEAAQLLSKLGASKGGKARRDSMSPEERKAIAKNAAEARWNRVQATEDHGPILKATHTGVLKIGDIEMDCFVLENGHRVLSERGLVKALGMKRGGTQGGGERIASFLAQKTLKPYISRQKTAAITSYRFLLPQGGPPGLAYSATILADICDVVLEARRHNALASHQLHIADQCEVLMRGFARVGIIALVDEATQYQESREKSALRKILEAYISGELLAWAERFPKDFYREMFRLWGWKFDPTSVKRPRFVGKLTKILVYEQLPPGVLQELESKNPPVYQDRARRYQHHRFLTPDIGNPHLDKQVAIVTSLMRASNSKAEFLRLFRRNSSKDPSRQKELAFVESDSEN